MFNLKLRILQSSAVLVLAATLAGVLASAFGEDPKVVLRFYSAAGVLGLGSIGLFFVGLVTPKDT